MKLTTVAVHVTEVNDREAMINSAANLEDLAYSRAKGCKSLYIVSSPLVSVTSWRLCIAAGTFLCGAVRCFFKSSCQFHHHVLLDTSGYLLQYYFFLQAQLFLVCPDLSLAPFLHDSIQFPAATFDGSSFNRQKDCIKVTFTCTSTTLHLGTYSCVQGHPHREEGVSVEVQNIAATFGAEAATV